MDTYTMLATRNENGEWDMRNLFAENLKRLLEQRDITQRELAKRTGISTSAISSYITGERFPRPGQLTLIAKALDIDPGVLTGKRPATETQQEELMRLFNELNPTDQETVFSFVKFLHESHSKNAPAQRKRVGVIRRTMNET